MRRIFSAAALTVATLVVPAAAHAQSAGNLFSVFLGPTEPVRDFAAAQRQDLRRYRDFFHVMLDHGVYLAPSAYEAWFVSTAHDDAALDRIHAALPAAAKAAAVAQGD